jgi:hypothetical protein
MVLLLPLLLVGVFAYMWLSRRGSTLTRDCLWRLDRSLGPSCWRCAACGAVCKTVKDQEPRQCLRPIPKVPDET